MITERQTPVMEAPAPVYEPEAPQRPRRRRLPRWAYLLILGGALILLAALLLLLRVADPNAAPRQVGQDEARALLTNDYGQRWDLAPPTCQSYVSKAAFIATERGRDGAAAPPDTSYKIVAVTPDGPYRRVDVRASLPGQPTAVDIEVDVKQFGSRWAVVDYGLPGHAIAEQCKF